MKSISSNTSKHDKKLLKIEARFFVIIATSKHLKHLACFVKDSSAIDPSKKIRNMYLLCRGEKTREKHMILNYALLYFSDMLVMQKNEQMPLSKMNTEEDVSVHFE